jgi:uncharacterized protein
MIWFLSVFLLLYGGLHIYGFLKAKAALAFSSVVGIPLAGFLLIMILAPVIVHYMENSGFKTSARVIAYLGYTWMAFIFLFFSCGVILEVYHLILRLAVIFLGHGSAQLYPSTQIKFFVPLLVSSLAVFYGFYEVSHVRIEKLVIRSALIPAQIGKLRIAQISDVHLGLLVGERKLQRIISLAAAQDPDVLVSTGDLVDGEVCQNQQMVEVLRSINPRYGKFAVTGNHEYYAGIERSIRCTEEGGFKVLQDETVDLQGIIQIAGVNDPTAKSFHKSNGVTEKGLLQGLRAQTGVNQPRKFVLFLKHQPIIDPEAEGLYDLQLSGHSHKGQIFPFSIFTAMAYRKDSGFLKLRRGSNLYVSRGTGTWGPPLRILAPPEITIIDLIHSDDISVEDSSEVTVN